MIDISAAEEGRRHKNLIEGANEVEVRRMREPVRGLGRPAA